tara:strand:- start:536 stop:2800 length:2265 start_codon:yes stop_codon:yes gene_type:complete
MKNFNGPDAGFFINQTKKIVTKDSSSPYRGPAGPYRKQSETERPREPDPNILHKFASYNTLFTLSALSQSEIRNPQTFFTSKPHDIIAQSGGIGSTANYRQGPPGGGGRGLTGDNKRIIEENTSVRDALYKAELEFNKNNDLYFQEVIINTIPGYNEQRRLTSASTLSMELVEPFGLTLLEKIKAAAAKNNFLDHLDAPFLLTIEFKGFDEKGKPMTENSDITKRVIPIKLVRMDIDVNQGGTVYKVEAIPYNEFGFSNVYMYPRTSGQLSSKSRTLAEVIANLNEVLNKQNEQEREAVLTEIPDQYQITIDESLFPNEKLNYSLLSQTGMVDPGATGADAGEFLAAGIETDYIKFTDKTNLMMLLENLMKAHPRYGTKKFEEWAQKVKDTGDLSDYNAGKDTYFTYFRIRSSIEPIAGKFDRLRQTNPKICKIVVEPYFISAYNVVAAGLHQGKNFSSYIAKEYNYIFTGDNIDILNLDINYKVAYFQSVLKDAGPDGGRELKKDKSPKTEDSGRPINPRLPNFGDVFNMKSEVSVHKSANANRTSPGDAKLDQFFDYITNPQADMVVVRMEILGDPAWLGQSQFIPPAPKPQKSKGISTDDNKAFFTGDDPTNIWNPKLRCYNAEVAEPVTLLNFVVPDDVNDRKGTYDISEKQKASFSGLYKVYQVVNTFSDGKFTQELTMTRFNNQDREVTPSGNRTRTTVNEKFVKGSTPYHGGAGGLHTGTKSYRIPHATEFAGGGGTSYDPDRDAGI